MTYICLVQNYECYGGNLHVALGGRSYGQLAVAYGNMTVAVAPLRTLSKSNWKELQSVLGYNCYRSHPWRKLIYNVKLPLHLKVLTSHWTQRLRRPSRRAVDWDPAPGEDASP